MKYLTYLLFFVIIQLQSTSQATSQTITCQTYDGRVFVWVGMNCPTGSIRVFL